MLVVVRGGVETIAHREAARRPRLIAPIAEALLLVKLALATVGVAAMACVSFFDDRAPVVIAGILILIPSAMCLDVGPRALGEFSILAAAQSSSRPWAWVWPPSCSCEAPATPSARRRARRTPSRSPRSHSP